MKFNFFNNEKSLGLMIKKSNILEPMKKFNQKTEKNEVCLKKKLKLIQKCFFKKNPFNPRIED